MNYYIRQAVAEDYDEINSLIKDIHNIEYDNRADVYLDEDNKNGRDYFIAFINEGNNKVFVAKNREENELVAYAILKIVSSRNIHRNNGKIAFLDSFAIKEKYKSSGIGNKLFNHIVNFVRKEKAVAFQMTIWEFNKDAVEFYERLGLSIKESEMELSLYLEEEISI